MRIFTYREPATQAVRHGVPWGYALKTISDGCHSDTAHLGQEVGIGTAFLHTSPTLSCPFNTPAYAHGLAHVGTVQPDSRGQFAILRRAIPGTSRSDGISPWPYLWVTGPDMIEALHRDFRDLVTLTVLCQPGYVPAPGTCDATLLKHHFVYDPSLPRPVLSRRTRARVENCARHATFEVVTQPAERLAICGLYDTLKARRGLAGGLFDMDRRHFEAIAGSAGSHFFRVTSGGRIGAMACGVVFADMLQILHTVPAEDGLRWNASHLLMHGLQGFAGEQGLRLLTGGVPAGGTPGLHVFKSRWANRMEPVHMIRIVNDHAAYAALCARSGGAGDYFLAYRSPL